MMGGAYREPAVNMYDEIKPIASRGIYDLMAIGRSGRGWVAEVRSGHVTGQYVSKQGIEWFQSDSGEKVAPYSALDRLLCDRVDFLETLRAVGR